MAIAWRCCVTRQCPCAHVDFATVTLTKDDVRALLALRSVLTCLRVDPPTEQQYASALQGLQDVKAACIGGGQQRVAYILSMPMSSRTPRDSTVGVGHSNVSLLYDLMCHCTTSGAHAAQAVVLVQWVLDQGTCPRNGWGRWGWHATMGAGTTVARESYVADDYSPMDIAFDRVRVNPGRRPMLTQHVMPMMWHAGLLPAVGRFGGKLTQPVSAAVAPWRRWHCRPCRRRWCFFCC